MRIRPFELRRQSHLAKLAVAAITHYGPVPHRRDPMLPLPVTKVGLPGPWPTMSGQGSCPALLPAALDDSPD
jgi:hypothetical protein